MGGSRGSGWGTCREDPFHLKRPTLSFLSQNPTLGPGRPLPASVSPPKPASAGGQPSTALLRLGKFHRLGHRTLRCLKTVPAPWGPSAGGEHSVSLSASWEDSDQAREGYRGKGAWLAVSSPAAHALGSPDMCSASLHPVSHLGKSGGGGRGDKPCRRLSPAGPNLVSGRECLALILYPAPTVCSAIHPPDANSWVQLLCTLEACWPGGIDRGSLPPRPPAALPLFPSPHPLHPHSQPPARGGSVVLIVQGSGTPPLCRCPGTGVRLFRELAAPLGLSRESWRERWKPTGVSLSGRGRWQRARTGL